MAQWAEATLGLEINTTRMGGTAQYDARPAKPSEPHDRQRSLRKRLSLHISPFDSGKRLAVALAKLHRFSSLPRTASQRLTAIDNVQSSHKSQGLARICAIPGSAVRPIWAIPDFEIASIKQPHQGFLRRLQNLMGLDPVQPNKNIEKLTYSGLSALLTEQYVPCISYKGVEQLVSFLTQVTTSQALLPTYVVVKTLHLPPFGSRPAKPRQGEILFFQLLCQEAVFYPCFSPSRS
ncbi:hypothetical protein BDP55DRAFT_741628 [Colletotrichum godetiae]|uniref:Uncharacterized protein n=1 Tax=Colletotrichum godetiae TaxID=1209918 RepID=A0AAJ0EYQ5_9PEZI|nr:uncharacterized protein BDP55DRAFT_741628 [Colletotrichum godetiae]KAK1676404.1 hypothetical protein BDP55DRAFT_741628 [Colletotrichum godetiae]